MKLKHLRIIIDFTLIIILVLLMCQRNMSVIIHEYMGIGMFILLFGHNILNYKWYKNLFKGKYSKLRILYMVIDSIIILFTILAFISSMMVSGVIFKGAFQNKVLGRSLHLFTTAWLFVLMGFHLGLHLESLVMKKYKRYKANKVIMNIKSLLPNSDFKQDKALSIRGSHVSSSKSEVVSWTTELGF